MSAATYFNGKPLVMTVEPTNSEFKGPAYRYTLWAFGKVAYCTVATEQLTFADLCHKMAAYDAAVASDRDCIINAKNH